MSLGQLFVSRPDPNPLVKTFDPIQTPPPPPPPGAPPPTPNPVLKTFPPFQPPPPPPRVGSTRPKAHLYLQGAYWYNKPVNQGIREIMGDSLIRPPGGRPCI